MMSNKFPNAIYIGQVAVFYIPAEKLDIPISGGTARRLLHDFFIQHYNAYTHEASNIQGFWVNHDQNPGIVVRDAHERYEVSFDGFEKVKEFVRFLGEICGLIQEDAIYLTMGKKSWLVVPTHSNS